MYSKMGGRLIVPVIPVIYSPNGLNKARFDSGAENLRLATDRLCLVFFFFVLSFCSFSFCPSFFSSLVGQVVTVARIF